MDYAKLAYLKAEDLERRLGATQAQEPQRTLKARFSPKRIITADYPLTEIRGSGSIAMIIKCKARDESGGSLRILLDGKTVAEAALAPEEKEYLLLAQAELAGGGILAAAADGAYLYEAEIIVMGSAAIGRSAARYSLAEANGKIAATIIEDDEIRLLISDSGGAADGDGIFLAAGSAADVIGCKDGFAAVYCDSYENIWITRLSPEGQVLGTARVGSGAASVAICVWGDGLALAKTAGGKLFVSALSGDGCPPGDEQAVSYGGSISYAGFVKGGANPLLAFESGDYSFLKPSEEAVHSSDTIGVKLICK